MSQTGKIRVAVIFFVVLLGAGIFLSMRHTAPDLLKNSSYLTDKVTDRDYYWLSNEELLYLTPNQMAGSYALHRLNLTSGKDAEQSNLKTGNFRLSPDGQWALTVSPSHTASLFTLERTDGKRQFRYFTHLDSEEANIAWTQNNNAIITLAFQDTGALLTTYPLDKPAILKPIPIPLHDNQLMLGVTAANHVLAIQNISEDQIAHLHSSIPLYDFALTGADDLHKIEVSRPLGNGSILDEVVLNPSGDRLVWEFTGEESPLLYNALQRIYGIFGVHSKQFASLWTSKTDGSAMREVGRLHLTSVEVKPHALHWTPDGRNISFLYKEKLYSIPVGRQ